MSVTDPALPAIEIVTDTMADVFDSVLSSGETATEVRLFAGEAPATAAWDAHSEGVGCDVPFVWVRVTRRYRTKVLPNSEATSNACDLPRAIDLELGVARCAVVDQQPTWEDYQQEFEYSLSDSGLLLRAQHIAQCRLRGDTYIAAGAELYPFGPIGGIIGWQTFLYIQYD
jgi:hypothetical protein